jgi:hypothetical protein
VRTALLATVSAIGLAACGARTPLSDEEAASVDASSDVVDASVNDVSPHDAAVDVRDVGDVAPLCTPVRMGNVCNDLVASGPQVLVNCLRGPGGPTPSGGTIVDGRYRLVSSDFYGPCPAAETDRIVWNICAGVWATVQESTIGGRVTTQLINGHVAISGTTLAFQSTCATTGLPSATFDYDATPTTFTLYIHGFGPGTLRVDRFVRE